MNMFDTLCRGRIFGTLALFVLIGTFLGTTDARSGVLQLDMEPMPRLAEVGVLFVPAYGILNVHDQADVGRVDHAVSIKRIEGGEEVFRYEGRTGVIDPESRVDITVPNGWTPTGGGEYILVVWALGEKNINGTQSDTIYLNIEADACDEAPTLAPNPILYLGSGLSGDFTWTVNDPACCYSIRGTIVSGRDAITLTPFATTQQVSSSSPGVWNVTVDTSRFHPSSMMLRFDWQECEGGRSGQAFATIVIGDPPLIGDQRRPLPPLTGGGTRHAGTDADPVNTFLGEFYYDPSPDLVIPGRYPIAFTRGYSSARANGGSATADVGTNWTHSYSWRLVNGTNEAFLVLPNGRTTRFAADGSGGWRQDWAMDTPYLLASNNDGFTFVDVGSSTEISFDAAGNPTTIETPQTGLQTLQWGTDGSFSVTNSVGDAIDATVDADGRITRISDGTRQVTYGYTDALLTTVTNVMGETTTYHYDQAQAARALLSGLTLPEGLWGLSVAYDNDGRVTSQVDADGNQWGFNYLPPDGEGKAVTVITEPNGNELRHEHDRNGNLLRLYRGDNYELSMSYDSDGRKTGVTDSYGDATTYTYNTGGQLASETTPDGAMTSYTYSNRTSGGLSIPELTGEMHPDGMNVTLQRDADGRPTSITSPTGTMTMERNGAGMISKQTGTDGQEVIYRYDAKGNLVEQDARGQTTMITYDLLNRPTTFTTKTDTVVITWRADNKPATMENTEGMTTIRYDRNGNLIEEEGPIDTRMYTYDDLDRLYEFAGPSGRTAMYDRSNFGRIETTTNTGDTILTTRNADATGQLRRNGPGGSETVVDYDAEGVITSLTMPDGSSIDVVSDALGRVTGTTGPINLGFTYSSLGRVTLIEDLPSGDVAFEYGADGRLSGIDRGNGASRTSLTRDAGGRITTVTDPRNEDWTAMYDEHGRMTSRIDPLGNTVTFRYDANGNIVGVTRGSDPEQVIGRGANGELISFDDGAGTTIPFGYDAYGRLTSTDGVAISYDDDNDAVTMNGITTTFENGRLAQITYTGGESVDYAYGPSGELITITDWANRQFTFDYDLANGMTTMTRPNGTRTEWHYDGPHLSLLRDYATDDMILSSIEITERDEQNRPTLINRNAPRMPSGNDATTGTYGYDAASRRDDATFSGNWVERLDGLTMTTNGLGQVTTITPDAASGDPVVELEYNGLGQIESVAVEGEEPVTYGRGVDYVGIPLDLTFSTPSNETRAIPGPGGEHIAVIDESGAHYPHYDEIGRLSFLTDDDGLVGSSFSYSPSSEVLDHEYDPEIEYLNARFLYETSSTRIDPRSSTISTGPNATDLGTGRSRGRYAYDPSDFGFPTSNTDGSINFNARNRVLYGSSDPEGTDGRDILASSFDVPNLRGASGPSRPAPRLVIDNMENISIINDMTPSIPLPSGGGMRLIGLTDEEMAEWATIRAMVELRDAFFGIIDQSVFNDYIYGTTEPISDDPAETAEPAPPARPDIGEMIIRIMFGAEGVEFVGFHTILNTIELSVDGHPQSYYLAEVIFYLEEHNPALLRRLFGNRGQRSGPREKGARPSTRTPGPSSGG